VLLLLVVAIPAPTTPLVRAFFFPVTALLSVLRLAPVFMLLAIFRPVSVFGALAAALPVLFFLALVAVFVVLVIATLLLCLFFHAFGFFFLLLALRMGLGLNLEDFTSTLELFQLVAQFGEACVHFALQVRLVTLFSVVGSLHRAADFADFHLLRDERRVFCERSEVFFAAAELLDLFVDSLGLLDATHLSEVFGLLDEALDLELDVVDPA
jgi:hypothetical protein